MDNELQHLIAKRDIAHRIALDSNDKLSSDWKDFRTARNICKSKMREKMKIYFLDKTQSSFGVPRKFWNFYKSVVKTKKSSPTNLVTNIKNTHGTNSQNCKEAADILIKNSFNLSFNDFKFFFFLIYQFY